MQDNCLQISALEQWFSTFLSPSPGKMIFFVFCPGN